MKIIHLSDIHFDKEHSENQTLILSNFFSDLKEQLKNDKDEEKILVITGDIVHSGSSKEKYEKFHDTFDRELELIGITKDKRYVVPGNHDVMTENIQKNLIIHEAIVHQQPTETDFNNLISEENPFLFEKFNNYKIFEKTFTNNATPTEGCGFKINDDVSLYCANSSIFSSGGLKKQDYGRLCIETRKIREWVTKDQSRTKILAIHHPLSWLNAWSKEELGNIIGSNFSMVMHGHEHTGDTKSLIDSNGNTIFLAASALFTNKKDRLGYSIVYLDKNNNIDFIKHRQINKNYRFVAGVDLSNNDSGIIKIEAKEDISCRIYSEFNAELNDKLIVYNNQPSIFINPTLKNKSEKSITDKLQSPTEISIDDVINENSNFIVRAPQEFGLTCLSLNICMRACQLGYRPIRIDHNEIKMSKIERYIDNFSEKFSIEKSEINLVIIDSLRANEDYSKYVELTKRILKNANVIIMETIDSNNIGSTLKLSESDYHIIYLWSFSNVKVKEIVEKYNSKKNIGDSTAIHKKISSDLTALNLHRTPLNCLTLLKVLEVDFDESPVNRTEMIKRILFLLFSFDNIPSYKSKPDLKDCEYILGHFCENIIRNNTRTFSRDYFNSTLSHYCKSNLINIDSQIVFDILFDNCIIINNRDNFSFRFSYWIYYFSAQQMHQNENFRLFILQEENYIRYPEIIEFYTGIDRRRNDAITCSIEHLEKSMRLVESKIGISYETDIFSNAKWNIDDNQLKELQSEISTEINSSKLPDSIKAFHAENTSSYLKPYNQDPIQILENYSVLKLMKAVSSSSRALRNSDYAKPELKKELIKNITKSWNLISKVLIFISPILAKSGRAGIDGANFFLEGEFGDDVNDRLNSIFIAIPENIISWYRNDLFSKKLTPLLLEEYRTADDSLIKHKIILLLIKEKPEKWESIIADHIASLNKNAFYLLDIMLTLRGSYKYDYLDKKETESTARLIKMTIAKHELGIARPGEKVINKVSDKCLDI